MGGWPSQGRSWRVCVFKEPESLSKQEGGGREKEREREKDQMDVYHGSDRWRGIFVGTGREENIPGGSGRLTDGLKVDVNI